MADFHELYADGLTEEETEALVDKVAKDIVKRGLQVPAIMMLELHKPLSSVMSQAAVAFAPFAMPFVGFDKYADYTRLASKRENVERLLLRIEALNAAGLTAKDH